MRKFSECDSLFDRITIFEMARLASVPRSVASSPPAKPQNTTRRVTRSQSVDLDAPPRPQRLVGGGTMGSKIQQEKSKGARGS